jgi:hypothetical protein
VFEEMAAARPAFAGIRWADIGEKGVRASESPRPTEPPTVPNVPVTEPGRTVAVGYRQLMSGQAVEHAPILHFQRRIGIEVAHDDAQRLGVATGDRVEVSWEGGSAAGPAVVQRRLRNGVVRFAADVPYVGPCKVRAADQEAAGA